MIARVGTLQWADETAGQLTLWDCLALLAQGIPTQSEDYVGRVLSRLGLTRRAGLASLLAIADNVGADKPTTSIERAATELCSTVYPPWLMAHCFRTYAIGALLGRGLSFDSEMLFVASMLHDVGLTEAFKQGSDPGLVSGYRRKNAACFAVRGAGVAERLATIHGWSSGSSFALAEAISLHLNTRVARSRGLVAHLLNAASAFDVVRLKSYRLPRESIRSIENRWPRSDSFCKELCAVWTNESDDHPQCRGAFLNRWGCFIRRLHRTCPPSQDSRRRTS